MLVDHFLDFKGCGSEDHDEVQYDQLDNRMSMSQFVARRQFVMYELGEQCLPDFARSDRLPDDVRIERHNEKERLLGEKIQLNDIKDE